MKQVETTVKTLQYPQIEAGVFSGPGNSYMRTFYVFSFRFYLRFPLSCFGSKECAKREVGFSIVFILLSLLFPVLVSIFFSCYMLLL